MFDHLYDGDLVSLYRNADNRADREVYLIELDDRAQSDIENYDDFRLRETLDSLMALDAVD